MKKAAFRSGARYKSPFTPEDPINRDTRLNLLTESVSPEIVNHLKTIKNPRRLAAALVQECRGAGKRFYRTVLDWDSVVSPSELRELTDFQDPVLAFNACVEVSDSMMRRYPGLLSMTGTELVSDHPAQNPLQLHHHSANIVLPELFKRGQSATVIDFTMAQLHPELAFPWVGPRREWVALVNKTPSPTAALTRELALL